MNWYIKVLNQYFTIDNLLGTTFNDGKGGILLVIYQLFVLIPSFTVSIRRLHDTNHSGWWLLIGIIPIIGAIVLLIFYIIDSDVGPNKFGPNPKINIIKT